MQKRQESSTATLPPCTSASSLLRSYLALPQTTIVFENSAPIAPPVQTFVTMKSPECFA